MGHFRWICIGVCSSALLLACSSERDKTGADDATNESDPIDGEDAGADPQETPDGDAGLAGDPFDATTPTTVEPQACGSFTIMSGRITPDILVVLDRSASMRTGPIDRWAPSLSGVKAVTAATDAWINYGLLAFPRSGSSMVPGPNGSTTYSCEPGKIDVPVGPKHAAPIAMALDGMAPGGATPTAAALELARQTLRQAAGPDDRVVPAYVLLVTDGAPNCTGGVFANSGPPMQDEVAVSASVSAITAMASEGVKTYVLGYGARGDAVLKAALDRMAKAGGTGDMEYRPVDDQATFVRELESITGRASSCDYKLEKPAGDVRYVQVKLDGVPVPLNADNGFSLTSGNQLVTLHGSYCTTLTNGGQHLFNVQVECEVVHLF